MDSHRWKENDRKNPAPSRESTTGRDIFGSQPAADTVKGRGRGHRISKTLIKKDGEGDHGRGEGETRIMGKELGFEQI